MGSWSLRQNVSFRITASILKDISRRRPPKRMPRPLKRGWLRLRREAVEREAVDSASYLTREVTVDLSVLDISREKEDWTDKELERLAQKAAFEAELEEFALDIMGEYLTGTVGGEIEDAAWSRENEEEETAEDTLGNGDSQETAILPGGKEAQIS